MRYCFRQLASNAFCADSVTALRRAGISGCRLHDLRQTYASNLIGADHSLVVLSRALAHSSIQQSAICSHIRDEALVAEADAAADAIDKGWIGTEDEKSPAQARNWAKFLHHPAQLELAAVSGGW